jgi:segregation and condensation protein B
MSGSSISKVLSEVEQKVEAILFVASQPVSIKEFSEVLSLKNKEILLALDSLQQHYSEGHGIHLRKIAGGWKLFSDPSLHEIISKFRDTSEREHVRLSKAAIESLAVIAYNEPVTRSEIEDIRGVRCERVIDTLLSHGLIRIAGRGKGTGSPLLYRTTPEFLDIFGLDSISELPTLDELKELSSRTSVEEE